MKRSVGRSPMKLEGKPRRKIVRKKAPHTRNTKCRKSGDGARVAGAIGFTYRESREAAV